MEDRGESRDEAVRRHNAHAVLAVVLAVAAALAAGWQVLERGYRGFPLIISLSALLLLLLPYFLFGLTGLGDWLKRRLAQRPAAVVAFASLLLAPYLIYGPATGAFSLRSLVVLAGFILLPTTLLLVARRASGRPSRHDPGLFDALAVLAIWLPFDFRWMRQVWVWPQGMGSYIFNAVLAVDLAILLFVCLRGFEGVGYRFRLRRSDAAVIAVNFLVFAAIAIPLGMSIGFLEFHPRGSGLVDFVGTFTSIFLLIGIPEELLFRGLIQNFLQQRLRREWLALALAAVIFGAAHLNNGPFPNWRYFVLASIAGVFYGRAYRSSGGIAASACVHALVDTVWGKLF
ncbi:MAG: type II CAAX prenyl endopeptidase Rce1 family protein [Acidobacteriota bacterium]